MKTKAATETRNPIVFRIWYPRYAVDRDFEELRRELKRIGADRVYLFDNGYMDNYQLADDVLAEKAAVLTRRIAQLKEDGIMAGINSGATIGHGGPLGFTETCHGIPDLEWWVDGVGRPWRGVACPLGPKFLGYCDRYFACLAGTGAREIFIDDDMRLFNHGAEDYSLGCTCDLHLDRFRRENGVDLTRAQLIAELKQPIGDDPTRIQKAWLNLHRAVFLEMAQRIERVVHGVDPAVRLGLMPVQNFVRPFGHEYFNELLKVVSGSHRPLLRTHDFHGMSHHLIPGSALYCRKFTPPETEHLVEIENMGHNFHDFIRSPRQTRYAILTALAAGMGGASINVLGDQPPFMDWERQFMDMFAEDREFFQTVASLTSEGTVMRGVPIRTPTLNPRNEALNCALGPASMWVNEIGDAVERILAPLGIPFEFEVDSPAMLIGRLPRIMGKALVTKVLETGAVIDVTAAREIIGMGLGGMLRLSVGDLLVSFAGHRFDDSAFCGPYAGRIVPTRRGWPLYRLIFDSQDYREVTSITREYRNERVAPGILASRFGSARLAVIPYPVWGDADLFGGTRGWLCNYHTRYLLVKLLEWVVGRALPVWVDGPIWIEPYYFERPGDGATILSLFNAMPDNRFDFDLVFGDGARLERKRVLEVSPQGKLVECPDLKIRAENGVYRLRMPRNHALEACDVKVLVFQ